MGLFAFMRPAKRFLWDNSPRQVTETLGSVLRLKLGEAAGRRLGGVLGAKQLPGPLNTDNLKVFGEFETDDGRRIPLYENYRDQIKKQWRSDYWPTIALLGVRNRIYLDSDSEALIHALDSGRTLPASLDAIAGVVAKLAESNPHELIQSDILSPFTKRPVIAARVHVRQADSMARYYRNIALGILQNYARYRDTLDLGTMRTLEVGCGMGYAVMAMAALGVGQAVGIDSVSRDYRCISERPVIAARLCRNGSDNCPRTSLLTGNIMQMEFKDNQFDLIHSASVLEHVRDLEKAFSEMTRVLKPNGLMIHNFELYLSATGGHASCTLDFPWGHARLTPSEFRRYLREWRPYEYDRAVEMYENGFNTPRVSFHDLEQIICRSGLSIMSWKEHWHTEHLPTGQIWQEVSFLYPSIGLRDLAVRNLNLVLMKL